MIKVFFFFNNNIQWSEKLLHNPLQRSIRLYDLNGNIFSQKFILNNFSPIYSLDTILKFNEVLMYACFILSANNTIIDNEFGQQKYINIFALFNWERVGNLSV